MKLRKISIPLAITIVLAGLSAGIILVNQVQRLGKNASGGTTPKLLRVTNIDNASVAVSWFTNEKTTGLVSYGETSSLDEIKQDIREEQSATQGKYFSHYVVINNLKPSTKYFFSLQSNGKTYDNAGKAYEVVTAPAKTPADNDIAQGKILMPDGQPAVGAIVYLSMANTITQSSLTDNNGHWMIPLSTARTTDLQNYSLYDREAQVEEIMVQLENQTANAQLSTKNDDPAPDISLGQSYNFLQELQEGSPTPTQTKSGLSSFNTVSAEELKIIYPSEDEGVNNQLPEFIGEGPKNQQIEIVVQSEQEISDKSKVNSNGKWNWTPKTILTPGEHLITVSYTDSEGFLRKVSRSFVVLAADQSNLPSFTSTPSGQKTTPTPTATILPTPTLKISPVITKSPTSTPTEIPNRTTVPQNPTSAPTSGTILPTKIFFGAGIVTLLIGIALILF